MEGYVTNRVSRCSCCANLAFTRTQVKKIKFNKHLKRRHIRQLWKKCNITIRVRPRTVLFQAILSFEEGIYKYWHGAA